MYRKLVLIAVLLMACAIVKPAVTPTGERPAEGPPARPTQTPLPQAEAAPTDPQTEAGGYIDTHTHLDGVYKSGGALVKDYETAAENLIALMDQYGVAKSLLMEVPPVAYSDLLGVLQRYPDRLYLMAGGTALNPLLQETDPSAVTLDIQTQFEQAAEEILSAGSIGFGEMLALHLCMSKGHSYQVAPPNHPLFLLLADITARHDVPIDLHMEAVPEDMPTPPNLLQACDQNPPTLSATIPPLEELLAHNRDAKIVWQHIGWDNTGHMTVDLLRQLLTTHPNLYLSLRVEERVFVVGGSDPMPNRIVDESWQLRPEWLELISDFPDRFMIGGDEFVGIPGRTPNRPQSFEETWAILDQLPPDLARQVGHDNAARIYNLD
ncbi:MAG: amidohydrolase family protein [Anaerolineales bacterium]